MRLTLKFNELELELDPHAGGSVSAFKQGALPILRPAPQRTGDAFDPLEYSAFPLIPFSGRIANGCFTVNDETVQLTPNMPPEPHAIHGQGWRTAWQVDAHSASAATLSYHHMADTWPWTYLARQTFTLTDNQLTLQQSVENLSSTPMPAGLGWHPYFPRENASVQMPVSKVWWSDDGDLPARPSDLTEASDLRRLSPVNAFNLDHAFNMDEARFLLKWPSHTLEMTADPVFTHSIVYIPPGKDFFCAEPATHAPDAVNLKLPEAETGLTWLAPGGTLQGTIRLKVT